MSRSLLLTAILWSLSSPAQAESFTYRGQLHDDGAPANGRYDLQLHFAADREGKRSLIAPIEVHGVIVSDGQFAAAIDLPQLGAANAWLEVAVKPRDEGSYWPLGEREQVFLKAAACPASWELGGNAGTVAGMNFLGTTDGQPLELRSNNEPVARLVGAGGSAKVTLGPASNTAPTLAVSTTISGGNDNIVNDSNGTIGGGEFNRVGTDDGDLSNTQWGTVSGGIDNIITGNGGSIGGGISNRAPGPGSTVAGGTSNRAEGAGSSIGGGNGNFANGLNSTISGGNGNQALGPSAAVGGGGSNSANGSFSVVPGGSSNCAAAAFSFAAGQRAKIRPGSTALGPFCVPQAASTQGDLGTFVWADSQALDFTSTGEDQFMIRARGGVAVNAAPIADSVELSITADADDSDFANVFLRQRSNNAGILFSSGGATSTANNNAGFFIDHFNGAGAQARRMALNSDGSVTIRSNITAANTGVSMAAGAGAWSALSDRHVKTAIRAIDPGSILERLVAIPISEWSYTAQGAGIRHLGPMAQDFAAAFGLGENDTSISTIDADGVALAAIQGLNAKLERENAALRASLAELAVEMAEMRRQMALQSTDEER